MSWLVDLKRFAQPRADQVGPGRLVLVVGPSGAGKDTLIAGARRAFMDDSSVVFPRRVITRPASASEDNIEMSQEAFSRAVADGEFALWWEAHGHRYGIPASIDDEIRADRTVICNVSRTVVGAARRRYAFVSVVLVTAPADVLAERLASRRRVSDSPVAERLARAEDVSLESSADFVIRNVGKPEMGVRRMINIIREGSHFMIT